MRQKIGIVGIGLGLGLIVGHQTQSLLIWTAIGIAVGLIIVLMKNR